MGRSEAVSLGETPRAGAVASRLEVAGAPGPVAVDIASLVAELDARRDRISRLLISELGDRTAPRGRESPALSGLIRTQVDAVLDEELDSFGTGTLPEGCPPSAASAAALIADHPELKAPLLELPRLAHMALWEAWFELVEARASDPG